MNARLKKYSVIAVLLAVTSLQTGCLAGYYFRQPVLQVLGIIMMYFGDSKAWYYAGLVLDEKYEGRVSAVNALPLDDRLARDYGVSIAELALYNEELNEVIETNTLIERNALKLVSNGLPVSEAESVAHAMGFGDVEELKEVLNQNVLGCEDLRTFAAARAMSESTASLYLQIRWNVQVQTGC